MRISDWSSDVCSSDLQFQGAVREAVRIPVAMSPLLQLPVIGAAIAPGRAIGIITADSGNLTTEFMAQAGFPPPPNPIVVRGLQDQPEFRSAVFDEKGTIDPDLVEAEVVAVARDKIGRASCRGRGGRSGWISVVAG